MGAFECSAMQLDLLCHVCRQGNFAAVKAVLDSVPQDQHDVLINQHRPDVYDYDYCGGKPFPSTSLQYAACGGHIAIVSYLVEMGAEVDVQNKVVGLALQHVLKHSYRLYLCTRPVDIAL
jgi:ankyrin repeat protein